MKTFHKKSAFLFLIIFSALNVAANASAAEQPVAIFHAFDQKFGEVENFVCKLGEQGYSHVQISPAQKSNPGGKWWNRYQHDNVRLIGCCR